MHVYSLERNIEKVERKTESRKKIYAFVHGHHKL